MKFDIKFELDEITDEEEIKYKKSKTTLSDFNNFWLSKLTTLPVLSKVALSFNSIGTSTSLVESSFLHINEIRTNKRNQLSSRSTDDLLTLFYDVKLH
mgnify:CR=1 FL=1